MTLSKVKGIKTYVSLKSIYFLKSPQFDNSYLVGTIYNFTTYIFISISVIIYNFKFLFIQLYASAIYRCLFLWAKVHPVAC